MADARALLSAGRAAASMAAALYGLEIQLKVLVCRRLDLDQLPRAFEIHDLKDLLILAGLGRRLKEHAPMSVQFHWDEVVTKFAGRLNEYRYSPESRWAVADAKALIKYLETPRTAVLSWLRKQN